MPSNATLQTLPRVITGSEIWWLRSHSALLLFQITYQDIFLRAIALLCWPLVTSWGLDPTLICASGSAGTCSWLVCNYTSSHPWRVPCYISLDCRWTAPLHRHATSRVWTCCPSLFYVLRLTKRLRPRPWLLRTPLTWLITTSHNL